jgi:hypothetical protein
MPLPKIWQWFSLNQPKREPSRFAAGGGGGGLKICQLLSPPDALRTETVRVPGKLKIFSANSMNFTRHLFHLRPRIMKKILPGVS